MTDSLLTTKQVAEMLGINPRTVTWRVRNGYLEAARKLPATGTYLFERSEIEKIDQDKTGELHADNPDRYQSEGAA